MLDGLVCDSSFCSGLFNTFSTQAQLQVIWSFLDLEPNQKHLPNHLPINEVLANKEVMYGALLTGLFFYIYLYRMRLRAQVTIGNLCVQYKSLLVSLYWMSSNPFVKVHLQAHSTALHLFSTPNPFPNDQSLSGS